MATAYEIALPSTSGSTVSPSLQFIGTATVLLRYAGFTILTDPNFVHRHERVDLGAGLSAERQTDPAMEITDLPPLDLVVLSHFHGDHFDQVAQQHLDKTLPIVTTPEAAEKLRDFGFEALFPLDTWATASFTKGDARLRITAAPGRHGPRPVSFALPDVMGSVLEFEGDGAAAPHTLYITGDTLVIHELHQIPERYPQIDVSLLHLGGTRVLGILVTMDADQGVEALRIIRPRLAIPIHYDDYDVFKSPLSDFQNAVQAAGLAGRVRYLDRGETYAFDA